MVSASVMSVTLMSVGAHLIAVRPLRTGPFLSRTGLVKPRMAEPPPLQMDWEADESPKLPPNALVIEEDDAEVWSDETLEFNGLRADPRTPSPLQAYVCSFRLPTGSCVHAFEGNGQALSQFDWRACRVSDSCRLQLVTQLLEAVEFLHGRGSAHLGLDARSIRIVSTAEAEGSVVNASVGTEEGAPMALQLRIIGLGAAVRLGGASSRTTYQMGNAVSFHAPELLSSAILSSNLRALFRLDAWAVGVLLSMIAGSKNASPFEADPDWARGILSVEKATRVKVECVCSQQACVRAMTASPHVRSPPS